MLPFRSLCVSLFICWLALTSGYAQRKADSSTDQLQQLIDAEAKARTSNDPAQVIAAAHNLTDNAEQQFKDIKTEESRSGLTSSQKKGIQARKQQLRQILGVGFNDWGASEARQQQYAEALAHFQQAEKWDPSTPGLMRNLGTAAFGLENYNESMRALNQAAQQNPSDQKAQLMLALSYFSLDKFADAARTFAPIGDLAMQDTRSAYAWAFSLARTNQPKQAGQIADTLAAQDLSPDVAFLVCQLYTATENLEHAVPCFRKLGSANPSMLRVHYEMGATLIHLDRPAEAIPELHAELQLNSSDVDAKYYLAYALLETSRREEALGLLRDVVTAQPGYSQAQYELGKTLLEDGKTVEAIEHLEIAAKLDATADYIHYQLQTAYRRAGRTEDANRELATYKQIKESHRNVGPSHESDQP
jgi:tetratricopeptide (TPR) repeat protein